MGLKASEEGSALPGVCKASTVTASSCACMSYSMKLKESQVLENLVRKTLRRSDVITSGCFF